jgi:hypothetical protein
MTPEIGDLTARVKISFIIGDTVRASHLLSPVVPGRGKRKGYKRQQELPTPPVTLSTGAEVASSSSLLQLL